MNRKFVLFTVLVALAFVVQPAWSQGGPPSTSSMMLGTVGNGPIASVLVEISPFNGDLIRIIGPVGYAVNGLAYDHTTDTLFASTRASGSGPDKNLAYNGLISIDPETGAATEIGPPGPGWGVSINNLSVNSKGEMYAVRAQPYDDIVRIDKTNGTYTVLGEIAAEGGYGLAFDGTDVLWLTDQTGAVYTIDLESGPNFVGNVGTQIHHGVFHFPSGHYIGLNEYQPIKYGGRDVAMAPVPGTNLIIADYEEGLVVNTLGTVQGLHTLAIVPQLWRRSHLIGTRGFGGVNSTLVQIDPSTGDLLQTIGPIGYPVNGLEYDASTGRLFATTREEEQGFTGLIEIDINTGDATEIGEGWGGGAPLKIGDANVTNLTANSYGELYGWTELGDDLVSIDKDDGTYEVVGESYIESTYGYGLAFDEADRLWLTNGDGTVYLVNQATGEAVPVDSMFGSIHHGDFDFVSGDYVGLTRELELKAAGDRELITADLPAGTVEEPVTLVDAWDLHTVSFVPAAGENMLGTIKFGDQSSFLVRFDPDFVGDAGMDVIGPVGFTVNGLEYDLTTETLYATTSIKDFLHNGLIQIDMETGLGTPVGAEWGEAITNLTSDSTGQLFAWMESSEEILLKAPAIGDDLVRINKSTAAVSLTGDSGVSTMTYGLAFDEEDELFLVNWDGIYTVDSTSGAATYEGSIESLAHHGDFDFVTGDYIGLTRGLDGGIAPFKALDGDERYLAIVNTANNSIKAIVPGFSHGLHTLTFVPPSPFVFSDDFESGNFSAWSGVVGN